MTFYESDVSSPQIPSYLNPGERNKEIFDMCVYGFGRNLKRQLPRFPETKQDRKTGRPSDGHLAGSLFTRLRTCVQRRLEIPSRGNEKNRAC